MFVVISILDSVAKGFVIALASKRKISVNITNLIIFVTGVIFACIGTVVLFTYGPNWFSNIMAFISLVINLTLIVFDGPEKVGE